MIEMKYARWEKMVDSVSKDPVTGAVWPVSREQAVTLLARQHAAMVRVVKKLRATTGGVDSVLAYQRACDDILAALAKQGGKK